MDPILQSPASFRVRQLASDFALTALNLQSRRSATTDASGQSPFLMANTLVNATTSLSDNQLVGLAQAHSAHPDFVHLAQLVSEAVLEVVFVALPGFFAAVSGGFTAENQKFVAELNVMVFTPCLIFSKLAEQLNADKLTDLAVIPVIFAFQTIISYLSAMIMSKLFGFGGKQKRRQRNFVTAMAVFGNSNSLPISLVLSLSKTIAGLHWDKIPGDNDDEVGARGILYLLIFQQLGQMLRWTWGFNVLLKPKEAYEEEDRAAEEAVQEDRIAEEGRYRDDPDAKAVDSSTPANPTDSGFGSGSETPVSSASTISSNEEDSALLIGPTPTSGNILSNEPRDITPTSSGSNTSPNGNLYERARSTGHITTFPNFSQTSSDQAASADEPWHKRIYHNFLFRLRQAWTKVYATISTFFTNVFNRLPSPIQKALSTLAHYWTRFWAGVRRQMNPPLWAMLAALVVASIPQLQAFFFTKGTLVNNSVTRAIHQTGGVAVPLILVVLGANLARSTLPEDQLATSAEDKKEERKLLTASLVARMVLPTIAMLPFIALLAKYVPVSILDDPIFIIVVFLLTGAPSALQLAQICQINGVFMGAMSKLLFSSYVVAIFPSTLVLVMLALEVVEWAVL